VFSRTEAHIKYTTFGVLVKAFVAELIKQHGSLDRFFAEEPSLPRTIFRTANLRLGSIEALSRLYINRYQNR
jgi:hypothetical protein